jgi:hypothetical protein
MITGGELLKRCVISQLMEVTWKGKKAIVQGLEM